MAGCKISMEPCQINVIIRRLWSAMRSDRMQLTSKSQLTSTENVSLRANEKMMIT
jgi:hypothetical protein